MENSGVAGVNLLFVGTIDYGTNLGLAIPDEGDIQVQTGCKLRCHPIWE